MDDLKKQARQSARARRKSAFDADTGQGAEAASARIIDFLVTQFDDLSQVTLAGYMPMRTELDPLPAMRAHSGRVCVPVIVAPAQPLVFHPWSDQMDMIEGPFKARIPATLGPSVTPDVLIVPLLAFSANGGRLGYGGGFYDRSLERLRAKAPTLAIGLAYDAQEDPDLPITQTDQRLDVIITPSRVIVTEAPSAPTTQR